VSTEQTSPKVSQGHPEAREELDVVLRSADQAAGRIVKGHAFLLTIAAGVVFLTLWLISDFLTALGILAVGVVNAGFISGRFAEVRAERLVRKQFAERIEALRAAAKMKRSALRKHIAKQYGVLNRFW
jgi:cobalamin biosynthesis protein CobD/CbiB